MADKSLEDKNNLTIEENSDVTPQPESEITPEGLSTEVENEELDEKTKKGFQKLIAKRDQELKEAREVAEQARVRAEALEKEKKQRELEELDETERLKVERDEALAKAAQYELKTFVTAELTSRDLMKLPLAEDIIESPWLVKAVKSHLPINATWEQTIDAVHAYLPPYLDTLVVPVESAASNPPALPQEEDTPSGETERNAPSAVTSKRVWKTSEIAKLSNDEYSKLKPSIDAAYLAGRVVQDT